MKYCCLLVFQYILLFQSTLLAQDTVLIYYNNSWKTIRKESQNKAYYREATIYNEDGLIFHGTTRDYYSSGKKQMTGNYQMGLKEGLFTFYYENGQIEKKGSYNNNVKEGVWEYWYPNGNPWQTIVYEAGDFSVQTFYNDKGKLQIKEGTGDWRVKIPTYTKTSQHLEGRFENGQKVGTWKCYIQDNKILSYTEKFKNNKFIQGFQYSLVYGKEKVQKEHIEKYDLDRLKFDKVDNFASTRTSVKQGNSYHSPFIYPKNSKPLPQNEITYKIVGIVDSTDQNIYHKNEVDSLATMFGGKEALQTHIQKNLIYPLDARREGKEGTVIISFVVEKDGSLTDIIVKGGFFKSCDDQALSLLLFSPPWHPALKNGKLVRQRVEIPITFKLN